jgi:tetratricopeptide (TPR) repeat protein
LRGFAHAQLHDYGAAEQDYATALALHPHDEDKYAIYVNRGVMRIRQDRLRDGMDDLQDAVSLKPNLYHAYLNMAQGYHKDDVLAHPAFGASTVGLLESPLGQGPFLAAAVLLLGRTKELQKAIEQIRKAIELEPALEPLLCRILAQLHMELHDSASALRDLEKAIPVGRNQHRLTVLAAGAAGLLGSSLGQGPLLAAAALIPKRANRQLAEIHFQRGRILHAGKSYEAAVAAYEEAVRIRPDHAEAHRLRGKALLELHSYKEAIDSFDQYFATGVPDVPAYLARARAKAMLSNCSSAIDDYTLALRIKPDSDTFTSRGWMHLLCSAARLAQSDFEDAIRLDPKNADAFNGLGYARVVQGKYSEGIRDAERALALGSQSHRLLYNAARTYAQAAGRMDSNPAQRSRQEINRRYAWQVRAFDLIRDALRLLSITERLQFWRNVVQTDPALDPIRSSPEWALLDALYSKPAN